VAVAVVDVLEVVEVDQRDRQRRAVPFGRTGEPGIAESR